MGMQVVIHLGFSGRSRNLREEMEGLAAEFI